MIKQICKNKVRWLTPALAAACAALFSVDVFAQTNTPETLLGVLESNVSDMQLKIDGIWVLVAAAMVFFMQAGFLCYEVGCVRPKSITSVSMKNVIDWVVVTMVFFFVGFGLMFGTSIGELVGSNLFFGEGIDGSGGGSPLGIIFFLFQLAFAATAATIVSGAMSERTGFVSYIAISLTIGLVIYPVFGHWAWGNLFFEDNTTWLTNLGFMDFAGSTVVHSVGGWVSLVGIMFLGPRLGRFDAQGNSKPMETYSLPLMALGVFILWFGWWGFNGGSTLTFNNEVGVIILNTCIAACMAGVTAFAHAWYFQDKRQIYDKTLGGILGGLVAVTACCNVVTGSTAVLVGISAGLLHNWSFEFLCRKLKLDDPVGAVPVHLVCGIWGTMCVALFGQADMLANPRWHQFGVQLIGIAACAIWTCGAAYLLLSMLKATIGLRVSPEEEKDGVQIERRRSVREGQEEEIIDEAELLALMEGGGDSSDAFERQPAGQIKSGPEGHSSRESNIKS